MAELDDWPAYSDDTGDEVSGTPIDSDFLDEIKVAIENLIHSATNPDENPALTTDEVVSARGSLSTLDARLDVFLNEDGTPKGSAAFPTGDQVRSGLAGVNLLANDDFLIWPLGDAAAPSYWTVSGTAARVGSGLGDSKRKHGPFALKVTGSGLVAPQADQVILDTAVFGFTALKGRKVTFAARVFNANSGTVVRVYDGVSASSSTGHTGSAISGPESDGWEWLTVTHTISASATQLVFRVIGVGLTDVFYVSGATALIGELAPVDWIPSQRSMHTYSWHRAGNLAVGTDLGNFSPHRPCLVYDVRLHAGTAPTGANWRVDLNHWDGAAFTSMFSGTGTQPAVVAAAKDGRAAPDGTYRYRCFAGMEAGVITDAQMSFDTDTVGSGVAGAEGEVQVRYLQYDRPFEGILAFDD